MSENSIYFSCPVRSSCSSPTGSICSTHAANDGHAAGGRPAAAAAAAAAATSHARAVPAPSAVRFVFHHYYLIGCCWTSSMNCWIFSLPYNYCMLTGVPITRAPNGIPARINPFTTPIQHSYQQVRLSFMRKIGSGWKGIGDNVFVQV